MPLKIYSLLLVSFPCSQVAADVHHVYDAVPAYLLALPPAFHNGIFYTCPSTFVALPATVDYLTQFIIKYETDDDIKENLAKFDAIKADIVMAHRASGRSKSVGGY